MESRDLLSAGELCGRCAAGENFSEPHTGGVSKQQIFRLRS
jgi:hypothetical protein